MKKIVLVFSFVLTFSIQISAQWHIQYSGVGNDLYDVAFIDTLNGIAVGNQRILKTTNGGSNWNHLSNNNYLKKICYLDSINVWVIAKNGVFLRSTDGGNSWSTNILSSPQDFNDIEFIDSSNGIIVGNSGIIFITKDGGITWENKSQGWEFGNAYAVCYLDTNNVHIAAGSHIHKSIDGGQSWETKDFNSSYFSFLDIHFFDNDNGIIVGGNYIDYVGIVWKTSDGGVTWHEAQSVNSPLETCSFFDANNWIALGWFNVIYHTSTGGISWLVELSNSGSSLNAVSFVASNKAWIVGSAGTILHADYDDLNSKEDENYNFDKPTQFLLQQNFPNPFNPSTSIQYAINNTQFVKLKVFDVLGKEVATLVNEEKVAGSFNVEFNASHLASGIYYYKLRAGDFVETKKMILMR